MPETNTDTPPRSAGPRQSPSSQPERLDALDRRIHQQTDFRVVGIGRPSSMLCVPG